MRKTYPFISRNWAMFMQKTTVRVLIREEKVGSCMLRHAETICEKQTKKLVLIDREFKKNNRDFFRRKLQRWNEK